MNPNESLDSSVVVISSDEELNPDLSVYSTPRPGPATKRKHDLLLETERQEHEESFTSIRDKSVSENFSPEMKRKNHASDLNNSGDLSHILPETVTVLDGPSNSKIYIIGTAHFSIQSQEDVSNVIKKVQPNFVVVELCNGRTDIMLQDEEFLLNAAKNLTFSKMSDIIRTSGAVEGVMYIALLLLSVQITKQLGMAPGGEFRRAFTEAQSVPGCNIILGDRPIQITISRAFAGLSWWQCLKLMVNLLRNEKISKEDVEKCKNQDFLETMVAELGGEFPSLKEVLVTERDMYLAFKIMQTASFDAQSKEPNRVVAVVGIGHAQGIKNNFGKVTIEDINRITTIPPKSLSSKIMRYSVRAALICGILYGIHKITPTPVNQLKNASQVLVSCVKNCVPTFMAS